MTGIYAFVLIVAAYAATDLNKTEAEIQHDRWVKKCRSAENFHVLRKVYDLPSIDQRPCRVTRRTRAK